MSGDKIFTTQISKNQAKDTGMAMVLILLFLGIYFEDLLYIKISIVVLLINMITPMAYKYIAVVWLGGSSFLGIIVSKIILSFVFFFVVLPAGVIRKIMGKDSLKLKAFKKSSESVMITRDLIYTKKDIEKPF